MDVSQLTPEDYASAEHAQQRLVSSSGAAPSLFRKMKSWQDFVTGVEEGFDTTWLWDYHNGLGCRDWLHDAGPLLTPALRTLCQTVIDECDARYRAATGPVMPQEPEPSRWTVQGRWWHDRFPLLIDHDEDVELPPSWSPTPKRLL